MGKTSLVMKPSARSICFSCALQIRRYSSQALDSAISSLKTKLDIKNDLDWKSFSAQDLRNEFQKNSSHSQHDEEFESFLKTLPLKKQRNSKSIPEISESQYASFFEAIEKKLNLKETSDWYNVLSVQVAQAAKELGTHAEYLRIMKANHNKLSTVLKRAYPLFAWDDLKFKHSGKGTLSSVEFQRRILEKLESHLQIKQPEDWYKHTMSTVTQAAKQCDVHKQFASLMANYYQCNLSLFLAKMYPAFPWDDMAFASKKKVLVSKQNQVRVFEEIEKELKIETPEQWYDVDKDSVLECVSSKPRFYRLYALYDYDMVQAVLTVKPEYNLDPFRFKMFPRTFFASTENQKLIFTKLENQLGITNPEIWYDVSNKLIKEAAIEVGADHVLKLTLRNFYKNSFRKALFAVYPQITWDPCRFLTLGRNTLTLDTQQNVFDKIGAELGVEVKSDWYKVSSKQIYEAAEKLGMLRILTSILIQYKNSLAKALRTIYPEESWNTLKLQFLPHNTFSNVENHKAIMLEVEKALGIQEPEDWYSFTFQDVKDAAEEIGLKSAVNTLLTSKYRGSLVHALMELFPEYNLSEMNFRYLPKTRNDAELSILKQAVQQISERLHIQNMEDWYRVSLKQINKFSKLHVIAKHGGLSNVLPQIYPEYDWNMKLLTAKSKRSEQRLLKTLVQRLLGDSVQVLEDQLHYINNVAVSLDVYVPELKLAFEYNGEHHYRDIRVFGTYREYQLKDAEKKRICEENGITLIVIPFTWDSSPDYVAAQISVVRPDLLFQQLAID